MIDTIALYFLGIVAVLAILGIHRERKREDSEAYEQRIRLYRGPI